MTSYKDLAGREWTCRVTFGTSERLREKFGIDLFAMLEDAPGDGGERRHDPVAAIFGNPVRTLSVLWECVPEAERARCDFASFADAMDGTMLDGAAQPLLDGITGLFADPTRRAGVKKMFEAEMALNAKIVEVLATKAAADSESLDLSSLLPENARSAGSGQEPSA